jgi:hypothetical protein
VAQALFVCGFEQTWPEHPVYLNRGADYLFRQQIIFNHVFSLTTEALRH